MRIPVINYIFIFFMMVFFTFSNGSRAFGAEPECFYRLAICSIFRNDAAYLQEWIEFHRLLGVEHFFLYNHLSEDHFAEVLEPYIAEGIVNLIDWPYPFSSLDHKEWILVQTRAYNDAIEKNREKCHWMAFIDTDEFLFPVFQDNLSEFLKDYEEFGGLCVSWRLFGTSSVPQICPGDLMIEKLIFAGDWDYHRLHKSIVQPSRVRFFQQVHSPIYFHPYFHVNGKKGREPMNVMRSEDSRDVIRINHYWTRDQNYFYNIKLPCRNRRGWKTQDDLKRESLLNAHFDDSICRFIPLLRERMKKRWLYQKNKASRGV